MNFPSLAARGPIINTNRIIATLIALPALVATAAAEEVPRGDYLRFAPLTYPRLVQENDATRAMALFGDRESPGFRDIDPVDGIDDDRGRVLKDLAVRFAPYLVQNTGNIPVNWKIYIQNRKSFPLFVDTWNISREHPEIQGTEEINLSALDGTPCRDGVPEADCKLLDLLRDLSPEFPRVASLTSPLIRPKPDLFYMLYLDFPGDNPANWDLAYEDEYRKTPENRRDAFPHAYVHPFIDEAVDSTGEHLGYEFVLQYWFFYPSNDGGNNHEGDWEHLNVLIAPRSAVEDPLSPETIESILGRDADDPADPLVIRRVDYYFHHFVMTLDFARPNVYLPRKVWKEQVATLPESRFEEKETWKAVRKLAYRDKEETEVNTHPIGYIGADNKGFDQVLTMPGGNNRNSHGTFPFPGRYQNIGPGGATEEISVSMDPREYWKKLDEGRATAGPEFKRGHVIGLADPDRLTLLPDWERVAEEVMTDPEVRRDWSWMLLPIHWGYPATQSPFAGIISHTDTGNLSPVGPTFSLGWNVSGSSPGFHSYQPNVLADVFPTRFQDGFRNDLGFLNLTAPVFLNLPPLDFISRVVTYPVKRVVSRGGNVYYPVEGLPFRFVGISSGVSRQVFSDDFETLSLNTDQLDEFVAQLLFHLLLNGADTTTVATSAETFKDDSIKPFYQLAFYIGDRFVSENTVRNSRSSFGFRFAFNNIPPYEYKADVNYWEYAGSLRYNILTTRLQPYAKIGYGWAWYRLEHVQANGVPFSTENSQWFKPKLWPNVFHYGVGIELVPWRRIGKFPGGAELGFRVEYGRYVQSLGLDLSEVGLQDLSLLFPTLGDVPANTRSHRHDFLFGVSVTF